jgi:hypothetical protein
LYYTLPASNSRAALAEWSDFKAIAGTSQAVGFGRRFGESGRVRPAREAPQQPDVYALGFGLVRLTPGTRQPGVEFELQRVPLPLTPADGARVSEATIRLVTRNVSDPAVRYVFEIEGPENARETSAPLPAGDRETSWSPRLQLKNGAAYQWRVRVVKDGWAGQSAASSFRMSK